MTKMQNYRRTSKHHHHDAGAHDKYAGHSVDMFRNKFWVSLALTIPMYSALKQLARLLPGTTERLVPDGLETVPIDQLREGDVVNDAQLLRRSEL